MPLGPTLRTAYDRWRHLVHEVAKFGVVGAVCLVIDLGVFHLLHAGAGVGPLSSKVVSTVIAASCAYAGNRVWSFRHRARTGVRRELTLFLVLNAVGLAIGEAVIAFGYYVLDQRSDAAANVANLLGILLGTFFRFLAYKRWVFLHPDDPKADVGPAVREPIPV